MRKILGMTAVALALCGVAAACPPVAVSSYSACATAYAATYAVPVTTVQVVNPYVPQVQMQVQQSYAAPAPVQVPQAECVPQPVQAAAVQQSVAVQSYAAPVAIPYAAVAVKSVAVQAYATPLVAVAAHGYGHAVAVNHGVRVAVVRAPARVAVVRVAARGQRVGLIGRLAERRAAIRAVRAAR